MKHLNADPTGQLGQERTESHLKLVPKVGGAAVERVLSLPDPVQNTIAAPELLADGQRILEEAYLGADHEGGLG